MSQASHIQRKTHTPYTTPTPPTSPKALYGLLGVTTALHELTALSRHLCETHASRDTPVEPETWQILCDASAELCRKLEDNLTCAEQLLTRTPPLSASPTASSLHAKRRSLLELLGHYRVDRRIVQAIDETLDEDAGTVLALLERDCRGDLVAFLGSLLNTLQVLALALEQATDTHTQVRLLATLAPADAECGDDVPFDLFSDDANLGDLEVTLAAIATYAVLRA